MAGKTRDRVKSGAAKKNIQRQQWQRRKRTTTPLWNRIYDPIIYPPPSSSSFSLEGWKDVWMNGRKDVWMDGRMDVWMDVKVEWLGVWMVNNTSGVWTQNLLMDVPKGSRQGLDHQAINLGAFIGSAIFRSNLLDFGVLLGFLMLLGSYLTESYTLS